MIRRLVLRVAEWLMPARCPYCGERNDNIPAHKAWDHADLPD
jgi:hypothetical protein